MLIFVDEACGLYLFSIPAEKKLVPVSVGGARDPDFVCTLVDETRERNTYSSFATECYGHLRVYVQACASVAKSKQPQSE